MLPRGKVLFAVIVFSFLLKSQGQSTKNSTNDPNNPYAQGASNDRVSYFTKLIEDGTRDALNYVLPTNARQFQVNMIDCFWNPWSCWGRSNYGTFDFIVIGSGSAGSVIANRLTEVENFRVLLLEAGTFENEFVDIPAMSFYAQGSQYNWAYTSVPQKKCCLGLIGKRCQFPRGRGIGGTTIINGIVYSRGSASDYDRWNAKGNPGWSYNDVLPYFIKSENHRIEADTGYHGTEGPWSVEYTNYTSPHIEAFLEANVELGIPKIDYNGKNHLGASRVQTNTKNGRRHTIGAAFIHPIVNRKNLEISLNSYVTKILINSITNEAYAVEFTKNNLPYIAYAKKEVILSAGAIASPQILMNSGIGPTEHLNSHGIKVIKNLSVGENLQDHICIFAITVVTNTSIEILSLKENVRDYLQGKGVFTMPGNNAALGFYKTSFSKYDSADLELLMVAPNKTDLYFEKGYGYTKETFKGITADLENSKTFSIFIYALHPDATGTVKLRSNDPFTYPDIDPKFLEDSYDVDTLLEGIEIARKLLDTKAFRKLDARFKPIILPNCAKHALFTRDYWICFMQQTGDEVYHPVGTCAMGPDPERGAVVNHKLQVHGIGRLRVADASIIPFSMVGHTSAPAVMVGERLADFIKLFYNISISN